ncbi:MAG: hypothetical protein SAK29_02435, partial [Scytonema sp. PMC 1069.18]|nr:hypothetical protein [Scytonema sp. PMC 1069.18]
MLYRDEWLLERGFHRFKRGSLPALPIYFQNQNRIIGLMFLLNIAMLCIYLDGDCSISSVITLLKIIPRIAQAALN